MKFTDYQYTRPNFDAYKKDFLQTLKILKEETHLEKAQGP